MSQYSDRITSQLERDFSREEKSLKNKLEGIAGEGLARIGFLIASVSALYGLIKLFKYYEIIE